MTDRELDALIAEKLFNRITLEWEEIPRYSTDPSACALVLDEIEVKEWSWEWKHSRWESDYYFRLSGPGIDGYILEASDNRYRAVCLAVLRALGEEV